MTKQELKRWSTKIRVLTHYGKGKLACVKCGFEDIRALSIDHIDGGGGLHRKQIGHYNMYQWLINNNLPEGFQTLCMNCQFIKGYTKDIPWAQLRKPMPLAKRLRKWIELTDTRITAVYLKAGMNLSKREWDNVRTYLCKMTKRGELIKMRDGVFGKPVKPVSISDFNSTQKVYDK